MPRGKKAPRKRVAKRKYQRKRVAKARAPFVESKHKDELLSEQRMFQSTDTSYLYVPENFTNMVQGDAMDEISGRWIYSKWIATKMAMSFSGADQYNFPINLRVRHGWIKLNLNPTSVDSESRLQVTSTALKEHVLAVLENNYDDSTLLPIKARDVVTLSDKIVKNNPRILEDAQGTTTFRNDQHLSFKWSPQRKIQYQKCLFTDTGATTFQCCQKNWIPFVVFSYVQAGTEARPTDSEMPKVNIGTRHYFTDS
jgi:hypothetical protein